MSNVMQDREELIMKMIEDVYKFMEAFDQIQNKDQLQDLYIKLIKEEFLELMKAVDDKDQTEELDACIDLIWVILGHMLVKGWNITGAWDEVTRSNMSKLDPVTGKAIHREDGKVIKPPTWSRPQLGPFLTMRGVM